jgi:hypothetical protein
MAGKSRSWWWHFLGFLVIPPAIIAGFIGLVFLLGPWIFALVPIGIFVALAWDFAEEMS